LQTSTVSDLFMPSYVALVVYQAFGRSHVVPDLKLAQEAALLLSTEMNVAGRVLARQGVSNAAVRIHLRLLSSPSTIGTPVDVLVVGGGLVGSAFAAAVSTNPLSQSLSVALVEPFPPVAPLPGAAPEPPSLRTSTISPSSARFLSDAGVWQQIPSARIAPFHDMAVWDWPGAADRTTRSSRGAGLGMIRFDSKDAPEAGADELGFVVDNDTLRTAVFQQLRHLGATVGTRVLETKVKTIEYDVETAEAARVSAAAGGVGNDVTPWPTVYLENGDIISARLIVVADGARSRIRTMADFEWFSHSYNQAAVVANVLLDRPVRTAYQRFLSTGPIALLPIASDAVDGPVANIIWSTTPAEADALFAADDIVFLDEVNVALREAEDCSAPQNSVEEVMDASPTADGYEAPPGQLNLPRCEAVLGTRGRFPLSMGHAPRYVDAARRTVLIGDAAHNVHPLAGQGANLGFADARSLSQALASAAATGRDVGGEELRQTLL
jgi:ubiquinone biosynthesis UbiH/UbiF/VisC/COQ6 family hydroxylase